MVREGWQATSAIMLPVAHRGVISAAVVACRALALARTLGVRQHTPPQLEGAGTQMRR